MRVGYWVRSAAKWAVRSRRLIFLAGGVGAAELSARALDLQWDPSPAAGVQGGPGTWANGGTPKWFDGSAEVAWNNGSNASAIFAGATGGTVNVSGTVQARDLRFDVAGYLLTGGNVVMSPQNGSVAANVDVTIGSIFSTANGMDFWRKTGAGTLTLSGVNPTYIAGAWLEQGTLSFANGPSVPAQLGVRFVNSGTRLRYGGTSDDGVLSSLTLASDGIVDVTGTARSLSVAANISGTNTLFKEGPGTLTLKESGARLFGGAVQVNAGTLRLEGLMLGTSRVNLAGGTLALRASASANFATPVFVNAGATGRISVDSAAGGGSLRHTVGTVTVPAGSRLDVTTNAQQSLVVSSMSLSGTMRVAAGGVLIDGAVTGGGSFEIDEATQTGTVPAQSDWAHGLHFDTTGGIPTISNDIGGVTDASNPIVGVENGLAVTYQGRWDMGLRNNRGTTLVLRSGSSRFVFGGSARVQTTYPESSGSNAGKILNWRPASAVSDFSGNVAEFDAAFKADLGTQAAPAGGLADWHVGKLTWRTNSSAGLPDVWMNSPMTGAVIRRGLVAFDIADGAKWVIQTAAQTYEGQIVVRRNTTFQTDTNLSHTGGVTGGADGAFEILDGVTLMKTGNGQLALSGAQGYAPATAMQVSAGSVVFNTDPGAGYLSGAYSLDAGGNVVAPPPPAPNLSVLIGNGTNKGLVTFAAGLNRIDDLRVDSGTASVLSAVPGQPPTTLVAHSIELAPVLGPSVAKLNLNTNRLVVDYTDAGPAAMIDVRGGIVSGYGTSPIHWTGNGIVSSSIAASDRAHALGYAEAAEVYGLSGTGTATFGTGAAAATVDATAVLVRYTLRGDANLDGVVDFNDLVRLAQNYNSTVSGVSESWWYRGDFNYDGVVDFNDLVGLAQNYNATLPLGAGLLGRAGPSFGADWAAAVASVPEPAALGALGVAVVGLNGGRRRKGRGTTEHAGSASAGAPGR